MNILLSEPSIRKYFDKYIDFLTFTFRFEVLCAMQLGKRPEEYLEWIDSLESTFKDLTEKSSFIETAHFRRLLLQLRGVVARGGSMQDIANGCENCVRQFIDVEENNFRDGYLKACAQRVFTETYSRELSFAVGRFLADGNYDGAIVAAFKCFDQHLQRLLKLAPSEHGETLINKAFSPDNGALKLNADVNEQRGLRNLAAGANAFFRNAVAHRTVFGVDLQSSAEALANAIANGDWSKCVPDKRFYDSMTAETAIALAALLMKIATFLASENGLIDDDQKIRFAFGARSNP